MSATTVDLVDVRRALIVDALDDLVASLALDCAPGDDAPVLWSRLRGDVCSAENERCGMTMFAGRSFRRDRGGDGVLAGVVITGSRSE